MSPAILDFLVLGERICDQCKGLDVIAEHLAETLRRVLALRAVGIGKQVQKLRLGKVPPAERKAKLGQSLIEQAYPGGAADDMFLVQQLFDLVVELMRPAGPQIPQPRLIPRQGVGSQFVIEGFIRQAIQLEREEQQGRGDVVHPLLHGLKELANGRIGHVTGMLQAGVADDTGQSFIDLFVFRDCRGQGIAFDL